MNKILSRVIGGALGLAMAVGVGVAATYHKESFKEADATSVTPSGGSSVTVNGKAGYKFGASKTAGTATIAVPSGAVSLSFKAAGWKGESLTLTASATGVTFAPSYVDLNSYDSISGTTTSFDDVGEDLYSMTLSGVESATNITLTATSGKRFVLWEVSYETKTYVVDDLTLSKDSISIDGEGVLSEVTDSFNYEVEYTGEAGSGEVTTEVTKNSAATTDLVATDDGAGLITLTSSVEGTYNVAVTTVDKNSGGNTVTKNVTVTVANLYTAPSPVKVTDVSSLSIADEVYFVYETGNVAAGSLSSSYLTSKTVTLSDGTMTDTGDAISFKLGRVKNGESTPYYTFKNNSGLLGTTAAKSVSYNSGTTTWTISISEGNAVVNSSDNSKGSIQYNSGSPRFTTYTSTQKAIQIYAIHATKEQVALEFQNTYLYMNTYDVGGTHGSTGGDGSCETYYPEAKAVYGTLTSEQKNALSDAALERLHDWAVANGDNFDTSTREFATRIEIKTSRSNMASSATAIIIAISSISLVALGGFLVIRRKKEQ